MDMLLAIAFCTELVLAKGAGLQKATYEVSDLLIQGSPLVQNEGNGVQAEERGNLSFRCNM